MSNIAGKSVVAQMSELMALVNLRQDYQAAHMDALLHGSGWLRIDHRGEVSHVPTQDVMAARGEMGPPNEKSPDRTGRGE